MILDKRSLFPRFILADRNGNAMAEAILAGLSYYAEIVEEGIQTATDVSKMPEWRLDEMAWELGCVYDYGADTEQKRYWIKNAAYLCGLYGTPRGIYNYLEGYFQNVSVEENWQYGGKPFHFRATVSGANYDTDKINWAYKAIMAVKNVRSVLDGVTIDSSSEITVRGDTDWFYVPYLTAAEDEYTGANDIEDWEEYDKSVALADIALTDESVAG